ncbi:hypothetical protein BC834DRAFT_975474 [Gloeopeniophorella convolvens]|nr:hypothetical protein BC834DRAFT_975474 [Gloeopeniophorella convolvens]
MAMVPDDVLLEIFGHYLSGNDRQLWSNHWQKLAHVCHRWKDIMITSSNHLGLRLGCTFGTPVKNMLIHSPPFPIFVNYVPSSQGLRDWSTRDEEGVGFALQQFLHRIQHISIMAANRVLSAAIPLMSEPAPLLTYLFLESWNGCVKLPDGFLNGQAPLLRELKLVGVALSPSQPFLLSATSLVSLTLERIPSSGYIPPNEFVARIQALSQLEELSIGFISAPPRQTSTGVQPLPVYQQHVTELPALKGITYRGASAYLEAFLSLIHAPLLRVASIQLFNQLTFNTPHTSRFIYHSGPHSSEELTIFFDEKMASIQPYFWLYFPPERKTMINVTCDRLDFQVAALAQICSSWHADLSTSRLTLDLCTHWHPREWQDTVDPAMWCALLAPFRRLAVLTVCASLVGEVGNALAGVLSIEEMLPGLRIIQVPPAEVFKVVGPSQSVSATLEAWRDRLAIQEVPVHVTPLQAWTGTTGACHRSASTSASADL